MASVVKLINTIKLRPTMYIGRNSISCLKAFIDGWHLRKPNGVVDADIMGQFHKWVEAKYNMKDTHAWDRIILFNSEDEYDALKTFFADFDKFISEKDAINR